MPLHQIGLLARTVNESGGSPIADTVAAEWGYRAGSATWCRSSASHVFVIRQGDDVVYLRLIPDSVRPLTAVGRVATLMATLARRGLEVVQPLPSLSGELVRSVDTELGLMHAVAVTAAPGEQISVEQLTPQRAWAWGVHLARIHREARDLGADLPDYLDEIPQAADHFASDRQLRAAIGELAQRLNALPRGGSDYGVVHGDFELDNLAWDEETPTAFDFDEAATSWFAADIAYAVRDLADVAISERAQLLEAFVNGYRRHGSFTDEDRRRLPLFAALHAARSLLRIGKLLQTDRSPSEPEWQAALHAKLTRHLTVQRNIVLNAVGSGCPDLGKITKNDN